MRAFADLYAALDETNKTSEKVAALVRYFSQVKPEDGAWAVYFLSGRRPRQVVPSRRLAHWAAEEAGVPEWLFDESYDAVGDMAETIALLLPDAQASSDLPLHYWVQERLLPLRNAAEMVQRQALVQAWREMDSRQRLVWNKLITGAFRVGVSQQLLTRALAEVSRIEPAIVAHRLMGDWEPMPEFYGWLVSTAGGSDDISRPYPFFLAFPLDGAAEELCELADWQIEWKWDGIRAQLIRRSGQTFLWSRGEELVTERFPEIAEAGNYLPEGTVIDGEILPWQEGGPLGFPQLQRRIGRKILTKNILTEVPVVLMTYDLLEDGGKDVRSEPLRRRRARLAEIVGTSGTVGPLRLSPIVEVKSWAELAELRGQARSRGVEGFMLKRLDSPYRVGRQRGDWWKWKVNPFTVDAVLIYAQRGNGKRASLYTDYTFGVWDAGQLVPIAKAYSGLTDGEIRQVDAFVRRNTIQKHGPVRAVKAELVFELAFEAIQRSTRHRSGIAVRFPRILRWRTDKPIEEADTLEGVRKLLAAESNAD
jgi:DNA ligase-1